MVSSRLVITAFVLWMLVWMPMISSAATACCDGLCVSDLAGQMEDARATLKQTQKEYVKNNMPDFCQRNLMLRFLQANKVSVAEPYTMPLAELEKLVDDQKNFDAGKSPWDFALRSTEASRNKAIDLVFSEYSSEELAKLGSKEKLNLESFSKIMSVPKPTSPEQMKSAVKFLDETSKTNMKGIDNGSIKTQALKTAACVEVSVFKVGDCVRALNILQEDMTPVSGFLGSAIVDTKLWKRVVGDNKYDEGIRLASLKLAERLKKKNTDKANVFDDLKNSFTQAGMNSKEADGATLDVLALISSGGANTYSRFSSMESSPSQRSLGLGFIGVALGSLDYMKMKSGQGMYSYPANVQSNCDNAKPYHFWMASHMARTLVKDHGFSPETAQQATFIAMKGYQMKRLEVAGKYNMSMGGMVGTPTSNKLDGQKLVESESYSPVQQVVRTDLAFAAAGAVNGANSSQKKNINVDHVIQTLMADSNDLKSNSSAGDRSLVESYLRFRGIYSPDSALEAAGK